jgi:hypothetical protein
MYNGNPYYVNTSGTQCLQWSSSTSEWQVRRANTPGTGTLLYDTTTDGTPDVATWQIRDGSTLAGSFTAI